MEKFIFFDWFGVICNKAFWEWAKKNSYSDKMFNELLSLADDVDRGDITLHEFRLLAGEKVSQSTLQVKEGIAQHVIINQDVISIIRQLKNEGWKVAILSNVNNEFLEEAIGNNGLKSLFDYILTSSVKKILKPDPLVYQWAIEKTGWKNATLVDDTEDNVKAFMEFGRGILFESAKQLREVLFQ